MLPASSHIARVYRLRPWILLVLAVCMAGAVGGAAHLQVDFTPQKIFESDDPEFAYLEQVQQVFGRDDNLIVVHVRTDDLFVAERLDCVRALHAGLAAVDGIVGVEDLTTMWLVRPGQAAPTPLLAPGLPLEAVRSLATAHPLTRGKFVSADGRAGLLVVRLDPARLDYDAMAPVVDACLRVVDTTPTPAGFEVSVTGIPTARVLIAKRLIEDQLTFFPWCTGLFLLILWIAFRDVRAMVVPMVAVLISTVFTAGLLGATGEPINIINNVLPVLLFVIAMSDAIHVIARYRRELAAGEPQPTALWTTVRHLTVACLLTSVTTAVGFGSLYVADIAILQRFGVYAASGVLIAYVVTVVFVPLAFSYLSPRIAEASVRVDELQDRFAEALGSFTLRHSKGILALSALSLAAAVSLGLGVEVENSVYEAFPAADPIVEANKRVEEDFAGILPMSIVVSWEEGTQVLTPEVLGYLAELQAFISDEYGFEGFSVVDLIREFNAASHRGDPEFRVVPEDAQGCARALFGVVTSLELSGRTRLLERVYAPKQRMLRLTGLAPDEGSKALNRAFAAIELRLAADAARQRALGIRARLSGDSPVASRGIDRLITDMFSSLVLAFAVIFPVMCLLLRSVRAGLVSMVPNVFPLVLTLGFMGLAGMDLRVTSVIVFTISLGLAVDDTIHFMVRFREEWQKTPHDYEAALKRTYRGTGSAIVLTTILLVCGFSALLWSNFPISQSFALCMEITVVGALVGDLIVLPAALVVLRPFRLPPGEGV